MEHFKNGGKQMNDSNGGPEIPKWANALNPKNRLVVLRDAALLGVPPEEILNDLVYFGITFRGMTTSAVLMGTEVNRRLNEVQRVGASEENRKQNEPEAPEEQDTRTPEERRAAMRALAGLDKKEN